MANEEHVEILKQGVEVWNRWREENPDVRPDLRGADLSEAKLRDANLRGANLRGAALSQADLFGANLGGADLSQAKLGRADLRGANLRGANLRGANFSQAKLSVAKLSGAALSQADLSRADLRGADLSRADLSRADLCWADLCWANLSRADLSRADLGNARVSETVFAFIDVSVSKGLETIVHQGPSYIDIHTIYRSGGKIPEAFLRGCGVPNTFIAYVASLTSEAIQYYSCFISYSSKDNAFARRLHADLQQEGVRCWFAPENMKIGDEIRPRIQESIKGHDKLLLVLSEHSINSAWVKTEVETALEEESRRKKTVLFPVRLDATAMETDQAWAADIRRTRHIGDFSHWKDPDSYQQAFDRLLRDLKASEA